MSYDPDIGAIAVHYSGNAFRAAGKKNNIFSSCNRAQTSVESHVNNRILEAILRLQRFRSSEDIVLCVAAGSPRNERRLGRAEIAVKAGSVGHHVVIFIPDR